MFCRIIHERAVRNRLGIDENIFTGPGMEVMGRNGPDQQAIDLTKLYRINFLREAAPALRAAIDVVIRLTDWALVCKTQAYRDISFSRRSAKWARHRPDVGNQDIAAKTRGAGLSRRASPPWHSHRWELEACMSLGRRNCRRGPKRARGASQAVWTQISLLQLNQNPFRSRSLKGRVANPGFSRQG
jgi:hypothetical protein